MNAKTILQILDYSNRRLKHQVYSEDCHKVPRICLSYYHLHYPLDSSYDVLSSTSNILPSLSLSH